MDGPTRRRHLPPGPDLVARLRYLTNGGRPNVVQWQDHPLGVRAEAYWKEHRPRYYRSLKKKGELDQALNGALNDTLRAIADLVAKGLLEHEAREAMLYEFLFPPGEDLEESQGREI